MPTQGKYASYAERPRAGRQRQAAAAPGPAEGGTHSTVYVPPVGAARRWPALLQQAWAGLAATSQEMEPYYEVRSEAWPPSAQGAGPLECWETGLALLEPLTPQRPGR